MTWRMRRALNGFINSGSNETVAYNSVCVDRIAVYVSILSTNLGQEFQIRGKNSPRLRIRYAIGRRPMHSGCKGMELLEEFQDVFTDVPGLTNSGKHSITLTTEEPIYNKPYSLPYAMQKEVEKELDSMLKLGVIEPSTSSYASRIVIIRKPDRSNRVCADFRKPNKVTVSDPEPMPQPE